MNQLHTTTFILCFHAILLAMQKKPEGESRIPTDIWSGLGFSKSMPESAVREKFGQMGISTRYTDSPVPSEYEVI